MSVLNFLKKICHILIEIIIKMLLDKLLDYFVNNYSHRQQQFQRDGIFSYKLRKDKFDLCKLLLVALLLMNENSADIFIVKLYYYITLQRLSLPLPLATSAKWLECDWFESYAPPKWCHEVISMRSNNTTWEINWSCEGFYDSFS